jgi:hypothetical protein
MGCATSTEHESSGGGPGNGPQRRPAVDSTNTLAFADLNGDEQQQHRPRKSRPANPLAKIAFVDPNTVRAANSTAAVADHVPRICTADDGECLLPFHPDPALEESALPVDDTTPRSIPERAEVRRHRSASIGRGVALPEPGVPDYLAQRMRPVVERGAVHFGITDQVDQFAAPAVDPATAYRARRICAAWVDDQGGAWSTPS